MKEERHSWFLHTRVISNPSQVRPRTSSSLSPNLNLTPILTLTLTLTPTLTPTLTLTLSPPLGLKRIRQLEAFRKLEMLVQPGMRIVPTIDCFTRPGSVQMVASSRGAFERDYSVIRALEQRVGGDGLFELIK